MNIGSWSLASSRRTSIISATSSRPSNDEQHQYMDLAGSTTSSCATSATMEDIIDRDVRGDTINQFNLDHVAEYEYVCPYSGCSQSFQAISELQTHYDRRHVVGEGAFNQNRGNTTTVHVPFRGNQHSTDPPLHWNASSSISQRNVTSPPQVKSPIIPNQISLPTPTSSRSSAEGDSESEFTDEEDTAKQRSYYNVPSNVKQLIKYLLCKVQWHLYVASATISACSSRSSSEWREAESPDNNPENISHFSSKGKRRASDGQEEQWSSEEHGHPEKRRKTKPATDAETTTLRLFACPFFQHDPKAYGNRRSCSGPGWTTVHGMKDHIYRIHAQPIACLRCYMVFEDHADLFNHLRGHPCQVSTGQPVEGIGVEQLKILRKRAAPCRLEEDKWKDIYQLLFPTGLDQDIPSPYYDQALPPERSRQFRRQLLLMIRRELFVFVQRLTGYAEEQLSSHIARIIERCQKELLDRRQLTIKTPPPAPQPNRPASLRSLILRTPPQRHAFAAERRSLQIHPGLRSLDVSPSGMAVDELYNIDWTAIFPDPFCGSFRPQT